jgi:hypothetical protein
VKIHVFLENEQEEEEEHEGVTVKVLLTRILTNVELGSYFQDWEATVQRADSHPIEAGSMW